MNHLDEEQLVLYYYGEAGDPDAAALHLAGCDQCRAELAAVARLLEECTGAMPVPDRSADYGQKVWQHLAPRLPARRRIRGLRWTWPGRSLAFAASLACLLAVAFHLGRISVKPPPPISARASQRILLVALSDHLERSRMVLVELVNSEPGATSTREREKDRAADLVEENRIYRQTALRSGDRAVAAVLDDLERVLLAIAHGPDTMKDGEWEELRRRIQDQEILFKIRVLGTNVWRKGLRL